MFGYFPTYQLGNVLSVQIWERLLVDVPGAYDQVEHGSFGAIYEWLRENLYRHGRKFTPADMIERLVGGPIDPEPYLRYLADKNASLAAA
jgi:carboxypeptidase Taq